MPDYDEKLGEYEKWISSHIKTIKPHARISLLIRLMQLPEFYGEKVKQTFTSFLFDREKNDLRSWISMMVRKSIPLKNLDDAMTQFDKESVEIKDYITSNKNEILYRMLISAVDEHAVSLINSETQSVQIQIRNWERKWKLLKKISNIRKSIRKKISKKKSIVNWLYVVIFGLISVVIGYIVYLGWAAKPNINIEFNVGEIIGGILAGTGA